MLLDCNATKHGQATLKVSLKVWNQIGGYFNFSFNNKLYPLVPDKHGKRYLEGHLRFYPFARNFPLSDGPVHIDVKFTRSTNMAANARFALVIQNVPTAFASCEDKVSMMLLDRPTLFLFCHGLHCAEDVPAQA